MRKEHSDYVSFDHLKTITVCMLILKELFYGECVCFIWGGHNWGGGVRVGGGGYKIQCGALSKVGTLKKHKDMRGVLKKIPVQRRGSSEKKFKMVKFPPLPPLPPGHK